MSRRAPGDHLFLLLIALLFHGCGGDSEISGPEGSSEVSLSLTGLKPLAGGLHYQAWLVAGTPSEPWGSPVVLFNVNEEGQLVDPVADTVLAGPFPADLDPGAVQGIGISLEASDTLLAYSSFTFILGGDLVQGTAVLSTEHWIAYNQSLSGAGGRFVLATPTDEDQENELGGIWFMDPASIPVAPGLELPDAPRGWVYESWVSLEGLELSAGRFVVANEPDSSAIYSGALAGPLFPGEDFLANPPAGLTFPPNLSGAVVTITMEPWGELDLEPGIPFFLRILEAQVPADATALTPYDLVPLAGQLPTGTATIQGS